MFRDATADCLQQFWDSAFGAFWSSHHQQFDEAARRGNETLKRVDLGALGQAFNLNVEIDTGSQEIRALRGGDRLPLAKLNRAYLIPSAFNAENFWTWVEERDGSAVAFIPYFDPEIRIGIGRARAVAEQSRVIDPALVFRALGDATRFAIAGLIAREPMSAAALARELGVSKPTITHHLHELRQAGLIDEQPQGKASLLSLRRATIEALSGLAMDRLFEARGHLPILRSRRPNA